MGRERGRGFPVSLSDREKKKEGERKGKSEMMVEREWSGRRVDGETTATREVDMTE